MADWAQALMGMGAGFAGQGPQYMNAREIGRRTDLVQEQQQKEARLMSNIEDTARMATLFQAGDLPGVANILTQRIEALQKSGGDPSHSMATLQMLQENPEAAFRDVMAGYNTFAQMGYLTPLDGGPKRIGMEGNQVIYEGPQGPYAVNISGMEPDTGSVIDRGLREREIALKEQAAERSKTKLSATAEKALLETQDAFNSSVSAANEAKNLAAYFEDAANSGGGVGLTFSEGAKQFFGNTDDFTLWRKRYNTLRNSQALQFLPPGVASDKDIEMAFKGVPPDNANAATVASFARGVQKMSEIDAAYRMFKSEFISNQGNPRNLIKEWRKKYDSPVLGEKVGMMEIYQAAVRKGIPPEQIMADFGIE